MIEVTEDVELKGHQEALEREQTKMGKILDQAGDKLDFKKVTEVSGTDEEKAKAFRAINDSCAELHKKVEARRAVLKAKEDHEKRLLIEKVAHPLQKGRKVEDELELKGEKSIGDAILKHAGVDFRNPNARGLSQVKEAFWNKEVEIELGVSLKTLMETGAGWAPETTRTGKLVDKAARPIQLIDFIPAGATSQSAVVYMEETTLTQNAAEESEGAEYNEDAFALTERSESVRKIASFLPVTDEQLEDVLQVRGYINNRLPMGLRRRLDYQLIQGDGVAPNLTGMSNKSGTQSYSRATVSGDKPVDALRRAMTLVRVTGRAMPNLHVIHSNDWEDIRLMKTNDGAYVWGHPSESGPVSIWGLPIAENDIVTEGTAYVVDTLFTELAERRGIVVKISDSHSDYFIKGKQAIRADMRVAFIIYRAAAICEVTL